MPFNITPFNAEHPEHAQQWDKLVQAAPMATFMQTRRFLAYHGNRFQDQSLMIWDSNNQLIGVLPAAVDPGQTNRIISHPGLSYGGLIHPGHLLGQEMLDTFQSCLLFYQAQGYQALRYKAIPAMYHQIPSDDDRYALHRLNAIRYRCDIASTIDVAHRPVMTAKRRSGFRKALESGMTIVEGPEYFPRFWEVLSQNLKNKYGVQPVHSLQEIQHLYTQFPNQIEMVAGVHQDSVVAGVVLFNSPQVIHAQYSYSSETGFKIRALDALCEYCIQKTLQTHRRYFDFGISTEQEGQYLNDDLYQFKSKFGAGGMLHEFYEVDFDNL